MGSEMCIRDSYYSGPMYLMLDRVTCNSKCYWPCWPCICCVLITVKECGCGDGNRYSDQPGEKTYRGFDPDDARRGRALAPADGVQPQAMSREPFRQVFQSPRVAPADCEA